jgi:PmbA protein
VGIQIFPAENSASTVIIAGNLKDMFRGLVAVGNDVDGNIRTGSILIESTTLAGS